MKRFEDATAQPYGYLVVDLKSSTSEQGRLQTDIFESANQQDPDKERVSDDDNASRVESLGDITRSQPP